MRSVTKVKNSCLKILFKTTTVHEEPPPDSKAIATPEPRQDHSGHMLGLGFLYTRLDLTSLEARPGY